MNVTSGSITVSVNQAATNAAYYSAATLDVSGLSSFTTNVTNFNIGVGSTTTGQGVVLLSNTANTVAATTLQVGHSGGNNGNGSSVLTFGAGTNVLNDGVDPALWGGGISVGVAITTLTHVDIEALIRQADADMYSRRRIRRAVKGQIA